MSISPQDGEEKKKKKKRCYLIDASTYLLTWKIEILLLIPWVCGWPSWCIDNVAFLRWYALFA